MKMKDILDELETLKSNSIYNYEYKYIKEIIWDDERNSKYGNDRNGYEKYKQEDTNTYITFSGKTSLRIVEDRTTGEIVGYIAESECKDKSEKRIYELRDLAKKEFYNALGVTNISEFEFWYNEYYGTCDFRNSSYTIVFNQIKQLINIVKRYNEDEDFKKFIDKIKG